ncbi:polyketide cyclase [Rhizobium binae]|uniref:SRPBCC domain-containing protein n=1 Tax=Rhizobium binae TaxID=1138190 RepID=UPI001C82C43D|nr:SRPBCC domain-containing protein [Rhizobium binae]MBX4949832.1 polyketide cyclase [Rhizobium binae]
MTNEAQHHEQFALERTYPNCLDHVWAAWAVPEKKKAWFGDGLIEMDFREGGRERGAFRNDMGEHTKEATFFEISERKRIVYGYSMAMNGRIHTVSLVTVLFEDHGGGTRLRHIEQMCVMPPSDGVEGRKHGWGALLDRLGTYLETDSLAETRA